MTKLKRKTKGIAIALLVLIGMHNLSFALANAVAAETSAETSTETGISTETGSATETGTSTETGSATETGSSTGTGASRPRYDPARPEILQNLFLYAETGVLMEQHSGKVFYDMRGEQRMHPASTTKIMTLLIAIERGDLTDVVTVGNEINQIPWDSSTVPLIKGEEVTLEELLYGLMLRSGNDAAVTIAVHISGSVEGFVDLMNERAAELGCTGTHFTNPHGYEDKDHYSTALDLAIIAREGMENPIFREIAGAESFTIAANNLREKDTRYSTKNQFVGRSESMEYQYEYGTGIKTGYFSAARHTFVASASKDGVDLIAVVLSTTQQGKWIDGQRLMDYGFAICQPYSLGELYERDPVELELGEGETLLLSLADQDGLNLADTRENIDAMAADFSRYYRFEPAAQDVTLPIAKGAEMGVLVFTPPEGQPLRYRLVASREVGGSLDVVDLDGDGENTGRGSGLRTALMVLAAALLIGGGIAVLVWKVVDYHRWRRHFK